MKLILWNPTFHLNTRSGKALLCYHGGGGRMGRRKGQPQYISDVKYISTTLRCNPNWVLSWCSHPCAGSECNQSGWARAAFLGRGGQIGAGRGWDQWEWWMLHPDPHSQPRQTYMGFMGMCQLYSRHGSEKLHSGGWGFT